MDCLDVAPPSRHLLGKPEALSSGRARKAALLQCGCGEPGCWPLLARIEVADGTVTWRDFEQPHRSRGGPGGAPGRWRYDALGPFVFERAQYEAALHQAAASHGSGERRKRRATSTNVGRRRAWSNQRLLASIAYRDPTMAKPSPWAYTGRQLAPSPAQAPLPLCTRRSRCTPTVAR